MIDISVLPEAFWCSTQSLNCLSAFGPFWPPRRFPKVSNYVQLTYDGQPKYLVGTDGPRLYLALGYLGSFSVARRWLSSTSTCCLNIITTLLQFLFSLLGVNAAGVLNRCAVELGCGSANLQIVSTSRFERMAFR